MNTPKIGDTLAVLHCTELQADGLAYIARTSGVELRTVERVYFSDEYGFSVQDSAGEPWTVAANDRSSAQWKTVAVRY